MQFWKENGIHYLNYVYRGSSPLGEGEMTCFTVKQQINAILPETQRKELVVFRLVEPFPSVEEHRTHDVPESQLSYQYIDTHKRLKFCVISL